MYNKEQKRLAEQIDISSSLKHWTDWKWHLRHTVRDIDTLERILGVGFEAGEKAQLLDVAKTFPMACTPYYLSLIDRNDYHNDPVFLQAVPGIRESSVDKHDMSDPLAEDKDSPAAGITHRYPDRVLFHVSNICSMYCRHCTRKRKVGDRDFIPGSEALEEGFKYIEDNPSIRDVLLSGGDPLMLPDKQIGMILERLQAIRHVEVVRIGTRMPVVLPYRITDELVDIMKQYQPLWINTHFNHPREITPASRRALAKLADAGFPLGNQTVLLAGVNDCPRIIRRLVHKLVQNRVRPYYLYQCDLAEGLGHFRTPVSKGIEIMESLIGHTSGFAVPTYVIDAPGGGGKIPVMPNYLVSWSTNKVVLRNYEGVITSYKEPDSYEPVFCDRQCDDCRLQLKMEEADDAQKAIGIEKLLSDYDEAVSLVPSDNVRYGRRETLENGPLPEEPVEGETA